MGPAGRPGTPPRQGRADARAQKRREGKRATALAVGLLILLLGFLALSSWLGLLGSSVRWGLVIVVLFMGTWLALVFVGRRSSPIRALRWAHIPPENPADPVLALTVLLRRAQRGRPYSQLLVAQRVRDALLDKVRVGRSLSYERLNEIRRDPAALGEVLGDVGLAGFVLEVDSAPMGPGRASDGGALLSPSGEEFLGRMVAILGRVEAWR